MAAPTLINISSGSTIGTAHTTGTIARNAGDLLVVAASTGTVGGTHTNDIVLTDSSGIFSESEITSQRDNDWGGAVSIFYGSASGTSGTLTATDATDGKCVCMWWGYVAAGDWTAVTNTKGGVTLGLTNDGSPIAMTLGASPATTSLYVVAVHKQMPDYADPNATTPAGSFVQIYEVETLDATSGFAFQLYLQTRSGSTSTTAGVTSAANFIENAEICGIEITEAVAATRLPPRMNINQAVRRAAVR